MTSAALSAELSAVCSSRESVCSSPETAQPAQLLELLRTLLTTLPEDIDECQESESELHKSLSSGPILSVIKAGLTCPDDLIKAAAADLVAKIAKCEECRCSGYVLSLVDLLMGLQKNSDNIATVTQAIRALGNICYEHDTGRLTVLKFGGAEAIETLLLKALDWPVDSDDPDKKDDSATNISTEEAQQKLDDLSISDNKKDTTNVGDIDDDDDDAFGNYGEVHELRTVVTGFLLNLTNSCDSITSMVCKPGCVRALCSYLERHYDEEDIPTHTLLALTCMADSKDGREVLAEVDLSPQLVLLLSHNIAPDVIEACLELTTTLAEMDSCKLKFAVGGVCEAVIQVIKRCTASIPSTQLPLHDAHPNLQPPGQPADKTNTDATSDKTTTDATDETATETTKPAETSKSDGNGAESTSGDASVDDNNKANAEREASAAGAADQSKLANDEDSDSEYCWQAIIQTATDLIVLILLGDESMPVVYNKGNGPVYRQLVAWLSSDNEQLQVAAALAMGNFARTDDQSMQLVQMGVSTLLLRLLQYHCRTEGRIIVQHAVLAALRNLTIAPYNKRQLLCQGALSVLLPLCLSVESYPVVFKLLATLRMVIDSNTDAAIAVGTCVPVVQRLLHWCVVEHPGVKGEACRLLAWLIKSAIAGSIAGPATMMTGPERVDATNQQQEPKSEARSSSGSSSGVASSVDNATDTTTTTCDDGNVTAPAGVATSSTDGAAGTASTDAAATTTSTTKAGDATSAASSTAGTSSVDGDDAGGTSPSNATDADNASVCPNTMIGIPVGVAVLHSLVEAGCLVPMLGMLQSEYPLMIHEASLAISLCTTVCRNLPNMLDTIDPVLLGSGVANTALRTVAPVAAAAADEGVAACSEQNTSNNTSSPSSASSDTAADVAAADTIAETGVAADGKSDDADVSKSSDDSGLATGGNTGAKSSGDSSSATKEPALPDMALFPHAMYNLLVSCLAIAEIEGGLALLRTAGVQKHFAPMNTSEFPNLKLASDDICSKISAATK